MAPINFCTLFDSNYLTRALAMYRSLEETGDDFRVYAVCFDDLAYQILEEMVLPKLVAIPLEAFETPELREVKKQRTVGEYCWTCTPHVTRYVLDTYQLSEVTYLDADLCFFEKPSVLLSEFEQSKASILITEHRYTPRYDDSAIAGIYCVQFMTFKADKRGIDALQWWQDRCLEWCYARYEDGKNGDQKYLDDWPQRFEGVHVLQHIGGGVAPWNVQQYALKPRGQGGVSVNGLPLVFFHFHAYKRYVDGAHDLGIYHLDRLAVDLIYRPYVQRLARAHNEIIALFPNFDRGRSVRIRSWRMSLRRIKWRVTGEFNEYKLL